MRSELILAILVVVFGASGTYLLLPHRHGARKPHNTHMVGGALAGVALVLFAYFWSPPGPWLSSLFFYAFAFGSVACAVLTVASHNPVHNALWFAAVVLSTSGLFLQAGASFLAAGTVIVYAGAIIVTFLFVIMLAQMEGRAPYDRAARAPFLATFTCFMIFFGVVFSLFKVDAAHTPHGGTVDAPAPATDDRLPRATLPRPGVKTGSERAAAEVVARAVRPTALLADRAATAADGRHPLKPHVAGLGETLYTDHLIVVELAGALLFVALIGALAIAAPRPPVRPGGAQRLAPFAASTPEKTAANV